MVQTLTSQMLYADPVVYDWAHIQVPTLAFGGAEDMLLGPAAQFQERMHALAKTIPNGNGRVLLLAGSRARAASRGPRDGAAAARRFPSERDHCKDGSIESDGNANCGYLPRVDHPLPTATAPTGQSSNHRRTVNRFASQEASSVA